MANEKGKQGVDLLELPLPQLNNLKGQFEEELSQLLGSFGSLKTAQQKFLSSVDCLEALETGGEGKPSLIPLTGSLYIPGEIVDVDSVVVDVGTGYFVTKSNKDARDFFKRKSEFLGTKLDELQAQINNRQNMLRMVGEVIGLKMSALAAEKGGKS
ncbi:prefoldin subunit 5 [Hyaloraphidium curvatum]|nr:prefoldin subunit 5 [Hyaloraphidium curvatum]